MKVAAGSYANDNPNGGREWVPVNFTDGIHDIAIEIGEDLADWVDAAPCNQTYDARVATVEYYLNEVNSWTDGYQAFAKYLDGGALSINILPINRTYWINITS